VNIAYLAELTQHHFSRRTAFIAGTESRLSFCNLPFYDFKLA